MKYKTILLTSLSFVFSVGCSSSGSTSAPQSDPLEIEESYTMFLEGDSITEDTEFERSWIRFTGNTYKNFAVSGSALHQIDPRIAAELQAEDGLFDVIVIVGGVNDIGDVTIAGEGDPVPAMKTAITNFILLATNYDVPIVLSTITPFGGTSLATSANIASAEEFNIWVLDMASSDIKVLDMNAILDRDGNGTMDDDFVSPNISTGNLDFIHPNDNGDVEIARAIDAVIVELGL